VKIIGPNRSFGLIPGTGCAVIGVVSYRAARRAPNLAPDYRNAFDSD